MPYAFMQLSPFNQSHNMYPPAFGFREMLLLTNIQKAPLYSMNFANFALISPNMLHLIECQHIQTCRLFQVYPLTLKHFGKVLQAQHQ